MCMCVFSPIYTINLSKALVHPKNAKLLASFEAIYLMLKHKLT